MNTYTAVNRDLFFTRGDKSDPRLGDLAQTKSLTQLSQEGPGVVIAGYPDDEGIKLNGGRLGAALGPDAIRNSFYRMTPWARDNDPQGIYDLGNLSTSPTLAERHKLAQQGALKCLKANHRYIGLGGGHDYGFPDGAAFLQANANSKVRPLVINFDAHLDVRPTDKGLSSGTPFYRLLNEYDNFDFVEVGIQAHCNSRAHRTWVEQNGGKIINSEDLLLSDEPMAVTVIRLLEKELTRKRPTFLSVDIDGFSSSFAMGCSQAWPTGFTPQEFFPLFEVLLNRLDVQILGIYEVSPPLDQDQRTAKLAAQIMYSFIFSRDRNV